MRIDRMFRQRVFFDPTTVLYAIGVGISGYSASEAHHARVDTRNVQRNTAVANLIAAQKKKKAEQAQAALLRERTRERSAQGFGSTIVGSRGLGSSNTGGKSLLG